MTTHTSRIVLVMSNVPLAMGGARSWGGGRLGFGELVGAFRVAHPSRSVHPTLVSGVGGLAGPGNSLNVLRRLTLRVKLVRRALSPTLGRPRGVVFTTSRNVMRRNIDLSPGRVA